MPVVLLVLSLLVLGSVVVLSDPAAAGRAAVVVGVVLLIHAAGSVAAAVVLGLVDRRTDCKAKGAAVLYCIILAGLLADLLAGVGAAGLPGPWYLAGFFAATGGLLAVLGAMVWVPLVRPRAMEAVGPEGLAAMWPLLLLPVAVVAGLVVRGVVALVV